MKGIKVGLDGLSALDKVAKALFIETKLGGNPAFATPMPTVATLTAARIALETAIAATLDGGKAATFAKNQAEAALDEVITQIAGYVVSVAGGDEALILSAGYEVRKPGDPLGPPSAPPNLTADLTDKTGEIKVDWEVVYGALEYELQRNSSDPTDESAWRTLVHTSKSKYLDTGLASASWHWYRVSVRRTGGISPWSDPARAMAR